MPICTITRTSHKCSHGKYSTTTFFLNLEILTAALYHTYNSCLDIFPPIHWYWLSNSWSTSSQFIHAKFLFYKLLNSSFYNWRENILLPLDKGTLKIIYIYFYLSTQTFKIKKELTKNLMRETNGIIFINYND